MGRRYLKNDEKILVEQHLTGAQKLDNEEIESLFEYVPNDRILIFPWSPYVDLYQFGLKTYDSTKYLNKIDHYHDKFNAKIDNADGKEKKQQKLREKLGKKVNKQNRNLKEGNLPMRLGEPLAIYDTAKEQQTVDKIRQYLHSKGYFNATVDYEKDEDFKLVTSIYHITKKDPYKVDSIFFEVPDSAVLDLVKTNWNNTRIKTDENYEQGRLVNERTRLNNLMQNNGYYAFSRQYVNYVVDTSTLGNKKVVVGINIRNPQGKANHKVYHIDSILFETDADLKDDYLERSFNSLNGVTYQFFERRYSEKILDWRVFLNKDSLYRKDDVLETQKQLSNMDIFKFIKVTHDTTSGRFVTRIQTSPLKKFQTSSEVGLNVSQGLPGPFFDASIKNRNTFHGLEVMELGGRVGFEGLSGATETENPYSSLDYGVNLSFTFPQFIFPLSQDVKSQLGRLNPKTRVSFGLNFNYRLEYQRNSISSRLEYRWRNDKKNVVHRFSLVDVNFIDSEITDEDFRILLEELFDQGNNLKLSFEPAFVSSVWYSGTYNIKNYQNIKNPSGFLQYRVETGGNTANLYQERADEQGVELYQFAKVNVDYRKNIPFNSHLSLAYRARAGIAIPYGRNQTLPYEKFFFAGGSNSIRAWEPRRLGPGSYLPIRVDTIRTGDAIELVEVYNNNNEKPAEIIFETSIELRHRLFGFVKGAIFVDAGNSWTLRNDPARPGSQFKASKFLDEIAVGAGYGVRFDLSFLILRLDAAWKIIDPGTQSNIVDVPDRGKFELPDYPGYSRLVWNLGIGYPF